MKLAAVLLFAAASCFAQDAPPTTARVMVQYASRRAVGMDQFGPAFVPYIFVTAWAENGSVDGFIITVSYSTPSDPNTVRTVVQSALIQSVAANSVVMSGEVVPSSIHVTAKAFSTRKDIADAVTTQQ